MGGTRLWSWGPAEFGWVARGLWSWGLDVGTRLRSWGPAEFGWVARGSAAAVPRFWMGGMRLRTWGPADGWVARGFGAGGPRSLDWWHAALALRPLGLGWVASGSGLDDFGWVARGSRAVWVGGTRLGAGARGPIATSFASTQHQNCSKFARRAFRMHQSSPLKCIWACVSLLWPGRANAFFQP